MHFPERLALVLACATLMATPAGAQQDGTVAYPNVYKVQFENDWVRLIRIKVPVMTRLGDHTHPPGVVMYVYLNDADPITFIHTGSAAGVVNRPAVKARSYRMNHTRAELHTLVNTGSGLSDYLRVEFRTEGANIPFQRVPAPPIAPTSSAVVEATNSMLRTTRVTVAPRDSFVVSAPAGEPALVIALTDAVMADGGAILVTGQERWVEGGRRTVIRPQSFASIQFLRVDLLTKPTPRQ